MNRDKAINISDEKLSAFLDAELPETEMEMIREQLIEDESLANRLADLAMVDEVVATTYATIDTHPLPNTIDKLLAQDEPQTATIIAFPRLQKIQRALQKHAAMAAGLVLVAGFGLLQSFNKDVNDWQSVAQILEQTGSGVERVTTDGVQIKPKLTFTDKAGDYCRQFSMHDKNSVSENIACRKNNEWTLVESIATKNLPQAGEYQTASGGSVLDEKVEQMATGDFFDAAAESAAINHHWKK